jgi:hypothetical protein
MSPVDQLYLAALEDLRPDQVDALLRIAEKKGQPLARVCCLGTALLSGAYGLARARRNNSDFQGKRDRFGPDPMNRAAKKSAQQRFYPEAGRPMTIAD